MFLITAAFLTLLLSGTELTAQGTGRYATTMTEEERKAREAVQGLVATHPDSQVRKDLTRWLSRGELVVVTDTDLMPPEMSVEPITLNGTSVLAWIINPSFPLTITHFDRRQDTSYKYLVIYHEYQHMKEHFSGAPLRPAELMPGETKEARHRALWESEYRALRREWEFAQRLGVPYLMADVEESVKKFGPEYGFLEAFYRRIKGADLTTDPKESRVYWQKLYRKKLHSIKPRPQR